MRRLILASLLILIASPCMAAYVDHSSPNVAAMETSVPEYIGDETVAFLLADGTVWVTTCGVGVVYCRDERYDPPIPVSEIRFWTLSEIVTMDGRSFYFTNLWRDRGPLPIGPISTDQENVGSMKSRYKTQQQSNDQK